MNLGTPPSLINEDNDYKAYSQPPLDRSEKATGEERYPRFGDMIQAPNVRLGYRRLNKGVGNDDNSNAYMDIPIEMEQVPARLRHYHNDYKGVRYVDAL